MYRALQQINPEDLKMQARIFSISIRSALLLGIAAFGCESAAAQGWLQKSTGIKTPDPIRKIAPKGLSIGKGQESTSGLTVLTPASIDSKGNVWSGSGRSDNSQSIVAKAVIKHDSSGRAYWTATGSYSHLQPVRAPQYDRAQAKPKPQGNIEFDNQVQSRKIPNSKPSGSNPIKPQNGLTQQQQEQALIINSIGQLLEGISQAAEQNRP